MSTKGQWGGAREGGGRKPKYNGATVPISLRIPGELLDAIDDLRGDTSRNEYCIRALRRYVQERKRRKRKN